MLAVSKAEFLLSYQDRDNDSKDLQRSELDFSCGKIRPYFLDKVKSIIQHDPVFTAYWKESKNIPEDKEIAILGEAKADIICYQKLKNDSRRSLANKLIWPTVITLITTVAAISFTKFLEIKHLKEQAVFNADYDRTIKTISILKNAQKEVRDLKRSIVIFEKNFTSEEPDQRKSAQVGLRQKDKEITDLYEVLYNELQYIPYPENSKSFNAKSRAILSLIKVDYCLKGLLSDGTASRLEKFDHLFKKYLESEVGERNISMVTFNEFNEGNICSPCWGSLNSRDFEELSNTTSDYLFSQLGSSIFQKKTNGN